MGFFVRACFAGCVGLSCDAFESTGFVVDDLDVVLTFTVATGLKGSGFLVVAAAAVVGFLAAVVSGGRVTSFLAAAAGGGLGCADVVLPVDGAVLTLETVLAVAAVESLVVAVGDLDVADVGLEVERPGEGLVVFDAAGLAALAVVKALVFGAVEGALLATAVVLGLAPLTVSVASFFLGVPFTDGLVPFVTVAAATEVVLASPADLLSGTLVWFLAVVETADVPSGLLGTAPANKDVFTVDVAAVFLPGVAETPEADLTSFAVRFEAVPGRELEAPAEAKSFV